VRKSFITPAIAVVIAIAVSGGQVPRVLASVAIPSKSNLSLDPIQPRISGLLSLPSSLRPQVEAWVNTTELTLGMSAASHDELGSSVALSGDGRTVLLGDPWRSVWALPKQELPRCIAS